MGTRQPASMPSPKLSRKQPLIGIEDAPTGAAKPVRKRKASQMLIESLESCKDKETGILASRMELVIPVPTKKVSEREGLRQRYSQFNAELQLGGRSGIACCMTFH